MKMKINILTDNLASAGFETEHGLSYLIEIDGEKILFDTGHSDIFLKNAAKMGIKLHKEVSKVVLSHGHWDHGDGLVHLRSKTLITHPGSFVKRYRKRDHSYIGLNLTRAEMHERFDLCTTAKPMQLTPNLWFLGEIPRNNNFEAQTTDFLLENDEDDFLFDDSALLAKLDQQLVVISGCAHSGICNICEHAKKVSGISHIAAVIGGFHLKDAGEQTQKTAEYFKAERVEKLLPAHCTKPQAKAFFREHFQFPDVKTGMVFEF